MPSDIDTAIRLLEAGRLADAEALSLQVLRQDRDAAKALHVLGLIAYRAGQYERAAEWMRASMSVAPGIAAFHNNLGEGLRCQGKLDDALAHYAQALTLNPAYAQAHYNAGIAYRYQGRLRESIDAYGKALAMQPQQADFHLNLAFSLLLAGDLERGLKEYEWRWKTASHTSPRRGFTQPLWNGEDLSGKTILLHAEQGFGDAIQFVRYVPLVCERAATVIVEVQGEVVSLMETLDGEFELLARGDTLPPFEVQCPLMSLPHVCGTTLDSVPASVPYLHATADAQDRWHARLGSLSGRKIGLAWAGRPTHKNDRNRSMTLETLAPLARVEGVSFISLQQGDPDLSGSPLQLHRVESLADFADTAGLLANLDLVVSVDTAIVHLAGAMAKPAWLMNPFVTDWRWMVEREDSPWYPTMRIFRQSVHGDWRSVVERVAAELARF
jgi:Flp pilus assembly protein TadD